MTTTIATRTPAAVSLPGGLPTLISNAGERTAWRFVEFFTATIRNKHTRDAYMRAVSRFLAWCEGRGPCCKVVNTSSCIPARMANEASAP